MFISFRYFIIISAAEFFIPQSESGRIDNIKEIIDNVIPEPHSQIQYLDEHVDLEEEDPSNKSQPDNDATNQVISNPYHTENEKSDIINLNAQYKQLTNNYLADEEFVHIEEEEFENEDTNEEEFQNENIDKSETFRSKEPPTISECAGVFLNTASLAFKKASTLSRATREAERHTRSIIDHIAPYAILSSTVMQAFSFIPPVIGLLSNGALQLVDLAGYGISTAGAGMSIGAELVGRAGVLVQGASVAGPNIAAGVIAAGIAILVLSPYIFDLFSSLMVTLGLKMASNLAYGAKSFMKTGSTMDTIFEMIAVFAENVLKDYNHG